MGLISKPIREALGSDSEEDRFLVGLIVFDGKAVVFAYLGDYDAGQEIGRVDVRVHVHNVCPYWGLRWRHPEPLAGSGQCDIVTHPIDGRLHGVILVY